MTVVAEDTEIPPGLHVDCSLTVLHCVNQSVYPNYSEWLCSNETLLLCDYTVVIQCCHKGSVYYSKRVSIHLFYAHL